MADASSETEKRTVSLTLGAQYGHITIDGTPPLSRQNFDVAYNALHHIEAGATEREYEASLSGETEGNDIRVLVNSLTALRNHGRTIAEALLAAGVEVELDPAIHLTADAPAIVV